MSLTFNSKYDLVKMNDQTVRVSEGIDHTDITGRFIAVLGNDKDDSSASYILNESYEETGIGKNKRFSELNRRLSALGHIMERFTLKTPVFGKTVAAGFTSPITKKDSQQMETILNQMLDVLDISSSYRIITRYENIAVFILTRI